MPQNQMEKENWSIFKEDGVLSRSISTYKSMPLSQHTARKIHLQLGCAKMRGSVSYNALF